MPASALFTQSRLRLLGILPLLFFLLQALHYWRISQMGNMLWMCNLGNLVMALGLLCDKPLLVRVSVVWAIPGLFIWLRYVVFEHGIYPASTFAHVGGLAVGLLAIRQIGMDMVSWRYAFIWYLILQLVSRLITSPDLNVNVAHHIYGGWRGPFTSYWKFWVVMTATVALTIWVLVFFFNKIWPARTEKTVLAEDAEPIR